MFDNWIYHTPVFESDNYNYELMRFSPWAGHRLFGYDYICNVKPNVIVELGSHYGCSAFAFLQGIKDAKLNSCFYAVDTWEGDSYTQNDYVEDIYTEYRKIQDSCFNRQNTKMLRMRFEEAVDEFETESIDLLHIDGSHIYEDVKNDFFTWKSKVKKDGVIFFHDISEDIVLGENMGSYHFWNEIKEQFPFYIEFPHSYGLGVLFLSREKWEKIVHGVEVDYYIKRDFLSCNEYKNRLRETYFALKDDRKHIDSLYERVEVQQEHLNKYEEAVKDKDQFISKMEEEFQGAIQKIERDYKETILGKDKYIEELIQTIDKFSKNIQKKNKYIDCLEQQKKNVVVEMNSVIEKNMYIIEGKEKYISELRDVINKYRKDNRDKESYITELMNTIEKYKENNEGKEQYIVELLGTIEKYKADIVDKEDYICDLIDTIEAWKNNVEGKDNYIKELQRTIEKYNLSTIEKDNYILELQNNLKDFEKFVEGKENYISELLKIQENIVQISNEKTNYILELEESLQYKTERYHNVIKYIQKIETEMENDLLGKYVLWKIKKKK